MQAPKRFFRPLIFSVFAFIFAAQAFYLIRTDSLTNDEPFEITCGYYYWKAGDIVVPRVMPPMAAGLEALPLLALNLKSPPAAIDRRERAYLFFAANPGMLQWMTLLPRWVDLLFGLGLGFLLWGACRNRPLPFLLSVLGLWALEPTLIAHSGLAKSDMAGAFFCFAAVLSFQKSLPDPGRARCLLTGLLTGWALSTKVSAIALIPLYVAFEVLFLHQTPIGKKVGTFGQRGARWGWGAIAALGWISLLYLPATYLQPAHPFPLASYLDQVETLFRATRQGAQCFYSLGSASNQSDPLYLPVAFFLKIPLPFLVLLGLGVGLAFLKRLVLSPLEWIPVILFYLSAFPASNMGLRMILPAFPFLILMAAKTAECLWVDPSLKTRKYSRGLLAILGIWLPLSLASQFPHYLSYANELVGSAGKAYFFSDSDLDWGQDQIRLSELARQKGWTHVKLALFSGLDPHFYGLDWSPWTQKDLEGPQAGWIYLVDAGFLQLGPSYFPEVLPLARGWALKAKPSGTLGDTWRYFEVPGVAIEDKSPLLHSAPAYRYYWKGNSTVFY